MAYIYMTTNLVNGKKYIGQSSLPPNKFKYYYGGGTVLKKALSKYGRRNFTKQVLASGNFNRPFLDELERHYIRLYNADNGRNFYNQTSGGLVNNIITAKNSARRAVKTVYRFNAQKEYVGIYRGSLERIAKEIGYKKGDSLKYACINSCYSGIIDGYVSFSDTVANATRNPRSYGHVVDVYTLLGEYIASYQSGYAAAAALGVSNKALLFCLLYFQKCGNKYYIVPRGNVKPITVFTVKDAKETHFFSSILACLKYVVGLGLMPSPDYRAYQRCVDTNQPFKGLVFGTEIIELCH